MMSRRSPIGFKKNWRRSWRINFNSSKGNFLHVMTMREQDHSAREQLRQITQHQTTNLEAVQLNQANTLSLVAGRLEDGLEQLAAILEENQSHMKKRSEQILFDHGRLSNLEREGWRPDPWKKSAGVREVQVKQDESESSSGWENPMKVKPERFPPPIREQWGEATRTGCRC